MNIEVSSLYVVYTKKYFLLEDRDDCIIPASEEAVATQHQKYNVGADELPV